jgi:hypothetical protein
VSGQGGASKTGGPLGNKFFLQTGGKCIDIATKNEVDRYIYINNVPQGNIPFISSGMGVNFSEFKGLIPGVVSNLNVINPFGIMQAFLSGSKPDCQAITLETIDVNNNVSTDTHYVSTVDIKNMDPCNFQNKKNPINNNICRETFVNKEEKKQLTLPDDPVVQIYFASLSVLSIYILYCLLNKK